MRDVPGMGTGQPQVLRREGDPASGGHSRASASQAHAPVGEMAPRKVRDSELPFQNSLLGGGVRVSCKDHPSHIRETSGMGKKHSPHPGKTTTCGKLGFMRKEVGNTVRT